MDPSFQMILSTTLAAGSSWTYKSLQRLVNQVEAHKTN